MYSEDQLKAIKFAAKRTKNQGEIAVYNYVVGHARGYTSINNIEGPDFTLEGLNVLRYIAEECKRQHSGEMSVYNMALAWNWADAHPYTDSGSTTELLDMILRCASLIEPVHANDYRRSLNLLIVSFADEDLEATNPAADDIIDQFYYEFEEIHPFRDGNGRTGKVIYNWLRGTMNKPIMPPLFWEGSIP